ncbi:MAG TPA: pyrimidine dimer DNA glycosylase/endonuclease V [Alphaproteobacteria bacterium]|nr:pyrimidine dimer DNA glycosylase/endonuclease V [Alphaproteobacteria bacterium]
MNLFITSSNPKICAAELDDRRLIKSILETALLLSTALREHGFNRAKLYRSTHLHHPVTKWVMRHRGNYAWALAYFRAACREYTKRYGRKHKSCALMPLFVTGKKALPPGKRGRFQNSARNASLGLDYTHLPVLKAYRAYLAAKWKREEARWTKRGPPKWFKS